MTRVVLVILVMAVTYYAVLAVEPPTAKQLEFFEMRIRPVLVEHCYQCHNSVKSAKGGLALDDRAGLLKGGDDGAIVVAGKPAESRLLAILRHEVSGMNMPKGGPKLDKKVIADFEQWIAMGLPDPREKPPTKEELNKATSWPTLLEKRKQWWSFLPIRKLVPPVVPGDTWSSSAIDQFTYAKMKAHQLEPAAMAEPAVLIRRLYYALIGLPPTVEELTTWNERLLQPNGYVQLVDHLLASPRFGERWARHWMDWIRYADSHGSEGDPEIVGGWHYRDYLIRALNADVPYDQLVREHVAGDLLAKPRIDTKLGINESIIGPAHWRMVFHGFAPTDALEEKVRFIDDQVNTFSKAFLGLTVSCARCHDHKFDAISQRDYYALYGVLASCRPGRAAIDAPDKLEKNRERLSAIKIGIRDILSTTWFEAAAGLKQQLLAGDTLWKGAHNSKYVLYPFNALQGKQGEEFVRGWERQVNAWELIRKERAEFQGHSTLKRWDLSKDADYAKWFHQGAGLAAKPSRAGEFAVALSGDKALTGIFPAGVFSHTLSTRHAARLSSDYIPLKGKYDLWLRVMGEGASARFVVQDYPRDGSVYPVIKLGLTQGWSWQKFDLTYWNSDDIHIELATAQDGPLMTSNVPRSWFGITEAIIVPHGENEPANETREHHDALFELALKSPPASLEELADRYTEALTTAIKAWKAGTLTDGQSRFLNQCLQEGLLPNQLNLPVRRLVESYRRLEQEIEVPKRVPSLEETVARDQPLYSRGDHKKPMEVVPRRFLEAINPAPYQTTQSGRLQLAEDLLRDDNPFTRRVIVNRLWHHLFGRGIVPTPDNFGRLGAEPTHPDLLDYMSNRFSMTGWSIKEMIRFMVLSKTWQLSSTPSPAAQQRDPENLCYSHAPVQRLEAEAIRDAVLFVSGSMKWDMYGSPVDGNTPRRSVYVRVQRNALNPFLRAFDFPEPFSSTGRRDVTNVPAQSLTLMNDPLISALASNWVKDVLDDKKPDDDEARLQQMFMTAFSRRATESEIKRCQDYLRETRSSYQQLATRAEQLRQQMKEEQARRQALIEPVRLRLLSDASSKSASNLRTMPQPIGRWVFKQDGNDQSGTAHTRFLGDALIKDEALVLKNQGHGITVPINKTIQEKTLEAWVKLDDLNQRGGGVMTIQTPDGAVFDAIVFGEQEPGRWQAGSNGFVRTQPFQGPVEKEAQQQTVHLAIVYHADGRIVGYRDGVPYGKGYQSNGPIEFKAGQAVVGFGIRHLPAGGNRMLAGKLYRAQLYDRALSAEEVQASFGSAPFAVTMQGILAALSPDDRQKVEKADQRIKELESEQQKLGNILAVIDDKLVWSELARAMFCMKEFIYIK